MSINQEKQHVVLKVALVVVVAVTNRKIVSYARSLSVCLLCAFSFVVNSATLPEERADIMYHAYEGGGMEINGPSVLVRKNIADKYSVSGNYYIDNVTGASIDVLTFASPYTEKRTEYNVSADYLHDKTLLSASFTNSTENDYDADTFYFGISQDFFGALTNVGIGFAYGSNVITKTGDPSFEEEAETRNFNLSISQIISRNFIMFFALNTITDQGFLNNPYRKIRIDSGDPQDPIYRDEVYPETRTSTAMRIAGRHYLPYRAAIGAGYRYFNDTWDITGHTFDVSYTHPYESDWIFDFRLRYYTQSQANFYQDFYTNDPTDTPGLIYAHDKEMSEMTSLSFGLGVSYEYNNYSWPMFNRNALSLQYEYIKFDYANFSNSLQTEDVGLGNESLYSFDASVIRLIATTWF